ncbi:hypothetical protein OHC33_007573 [Knufia fluminis]|uniref:Uncharacterized protein n=1 Tax=Knufia fluminis TaxID=191047 RepID=A0AAN8IKT3_9EURO|nr:hypothetical protein OHC33_007573 [Knufia fluminis]
MVLSQVANEEYMSDIMFDHTGLERSKFYFKMLQLLRIMNDSIDDTRQRLRDWPPEWQRQINRFVVGNYCDVAEFETLKSAWQVIQADCERDLNGIQQRIVKKQAEIAFLRDGLFNATAVREALLARNTNQNIMVFTVVTIVFLPLSFVTSFCGMDSVLGGKSITASMVPFGTMLAALSVGTYIFAFGSLEWYKTRRSGTSSTIRAYRKCMAAAKCAWRTVIPQRNRRSDLEDPEQLTLHSTSANASNGGPTSPVTGHVPAQPGNNALPASNSSRSTIVQSSG